MYYLYSLDAIIISLITLFSYLFTINPITKPYTPFLFVFFLITIVFLCLFILSQFENTQKRSICYKLLLHSSVAGCLLAVGTTGWFSSPFFYLIYCLALALVFLLSALTSFTFVVTLIAVLLLQPNILQNINSVISLFSLFILIPFAYLITNLHLKSKQNEKSILILQDDKDEKEGQTKAEELLHNKITKFAADLREDLSDIKQLNYFITKAKNSGELERRQREILYSAEHALTTLNTFESESTGSTVHKNS